MQHYGCANLYTLSKGPAERMNKSDTFIVISHRITRFLEAHRSSCVCLLLLSPRDDCKFGGWRDTRRITNDQTRLLNGDLRPQERPQSTLGSPSSWLFWQAIYQPARIARTGFAGVPYGRMRMKYRRRCSVSADRRIWREGKTLLNKYAPGSF